MSDELFPYYEQELLFIREFAEDFAKAYPATAGRLQLEANRSADPHIERMIESFALIAGRIQRKLDDEFPELTDAMLGVLYPHYLAPIPSMSIVQFNLDPAQTQLPEGFSIPRGSAIQSNPVQDIRCKFKTCYPTQLWPLDCNSATLQSPPFPAGIVSPPRTAGAIRLELECRGKNRFDTMSLDKLRFYLAGSNHIIAGLYELIFNHVTQVVVRSLDDGDEKQLILQPSECLQQVGLDIEDSILPYPKRSFLGYRLLTEFFSFPQKFRFLDLAGWDKIAQAGFGQKVEVILFLDRTIKRLEPEIDTDTFRLGCSPIVNLFSQIAEPIQLTQTKFEYKVTPDVQQPFGKEIYSIDSVIHSDPTTSTTVEYQPFYSFRHDSSRDSQNAFWYASRRASRSENDRGSDVYINLVDRGFDPRLPAESTLVVNTTCTNRNLPELLQQAGENLQFQLEMAAPLESIRCLESPTSPLRPPLRRGAHWALISHLNLNHLSLSDPIDARDALREILRLYDFSDPKAGQQQQSDIHQQIIDGIISIQTRRVVGRVNSSAGGGFTRGIEVTIQFDEEKYVGTGVFLFASVLERFLGMYVSINSFSQLVGKTSQRESAFKKWPPRTAELQLI